jgi:hypothetical protein
MSYDALYYPWIDPPSKVMLMNAVLYWDRLYTIVPESEEDPFQRPWTKAALDYGFLRPRPVNSYCPEVSRASNDFAVDLQRSAIENAVRRVKGLSIKSDPEGYRIHPGKLSRQLLPAGLEPKLRRQIWKRSTADKDGYLLMNREFALPYMSRLASVVADEDGISPFTDQRWGRDIVVDRFVDFDNDNQTAANEARLITLAFGTIRVRADTSLNQLLNFRDSKDHLLTRYRKAIHSLALQVTGAGSENAQEREIQRIVKEMFEPAHEELDAKMREAGFDLTLNILQATAAAGVGAIFGGLRGAICGGLVSVGFSVGRWRMAGNRVAQEHPMTYLVELRKRFHEERDADA